MPAASRFSVPVRWRRLWSAPRGRGETGGLTCGWLKSRSIRPSRTYEAAVKEKIEPAVRLEPGVLARTRIRTKRTPARVFVLEMYADVAAYKAHLERLISRNHRPHTQDMVKSAHSFFATNRAHPACREAPK